MINIVYIDLFSFWGFSYGKLWIFFKRSFCIVKVFFFVKFFILCLIMMRDVLVYLENFKFDIC